MTSQGGITQKYVITRGLKIGYSFVSVNSNSTTAADSRDFGIYGFYGNSGVYNYGGIYRNSTTKSWTLFTSTAEPDFAAGTATTLLTGYAKANLDINSLLCSSITNSGTTSLQGAVTVVGQLAASDGILAAPGITFSNELGSGLYRLSAGRVALVALGTPLVDYNSTRVLLPTCGIYAPNVGTTSASAPAYAFSSAPTTGHRYNGSAMVFSVAGTDIMQMGTSLISLQRIFATYSGLPTAPDITFNDGVGTTGLYSSSTAPGINFAISGTRIGTYSAAGLQVLQLSTPTITSTGTISIGQPLSMGSNGITTTGTISTGTLTSAGTLAVTAPVSLGNNSITGVNSLSLSTLTGPANIAVSKNLDMGSNILYATDIRGIGYIVNFNNGNGYVGVNSIKQRISFQTASYTIVTWDHQVEFNVSTASNCYLPVGNTFLGQEFIIILNGSGTLTVVCAGTDIFEGGLTSITMTRSVSQIHLTPSSSGAIWLTL